MRSEKDDDRQFYSSYINDIVQKEMLKAKKDKDGFNTKFLNGHVFQDLMFNQVGFNWLSITLILSACLCLDFCFSLPLQSFSLIL